MDNSTQTYKDIVLSVVRHLLTATSAYLIHRGFVTADQANFLVTELGGLAFAGVVAVWVWVKSHTQAKLQDKQIAVALDSPASTPVSVVKAKAAQEV